MFDFLELFGLKGFTNQDKQNSNSNVDMVNPSDPQTSDLMPAPQITQNTETPAVSMPSSPTADLAQAANMPIVPNSTLPADSSPIPTMPNDMMPQADSQTPSLLTDQAQDIPSVSQTPDVSNNPLTTFQDITGVNPQSEPKSEVNNMQQVAEVQNPQSNAEPAVVLGTNPTPETTIDQINTQQTVSFGGPNLVQNPVVNSDQPVLDNLPSAQSQPQVEQNDAQQTV